MTERLRVRAGKATIEEVCDQCADPRSGCCIELAKWKAARPADNRELLRELVGILSKELRGFTVTYKPLSASFAIDDNEIHRLLSVICRCFPD